MKQTTIVQVPLRPPPPPPPPGIAARLLVNRVADEEAGGDMNLFRRYCLVNESLTEAFADTSAGGAAAILAWLRLSSSRQLEWYDGGNYQGKDMCHMQKALSTGVATRARGEGLKAHLARMALSTLPRGGGEGDAIRMTILDLLRNNGIKEGHRPGIECQFLAQWHQKLHSNTTMDDIAICEAYLHFLHGTGDWGDFWWCASERPVRDRQLDLLLINSCRCHALCTSCTALAAGGTTGGACLHLRVLPAFLMSFKFCATQAWMTPPPALGQHCTAILTAGACVTTETRHLNRGVCRNLREHLATKRFDQQHATVGLTAHTPSRCSNSLRWPSRSRYRVFVVKHTLTHGGVRRCLWEHYSL